MHLSMQTSHALWILSVLSNWPVAKPMPVSAIADEMNVRACRVAKVVQVLAKLGFVRTCRGRNGGVELAQSSEPLLVGDVVRALESLRVRRYTPSSPKGPLQREWKLLQKIVVDANEAVFDVLDRHAVIELGHPESSDAIPLSC